MTHRSRLFPSTPVFLPIPLIHKFLLPRMLKGWTSPRADYTRPFEECRAALPRIPRPGHGWLTKGIFSIIPRNVSLSTPSSDGIRLKRVSRSKSIKGYYSPPPSWRSLKDRCTFSTRRHLSLPPSLFIYLSLNLHPKCERTHLERRGDTHVIGKEIASSLGKNRVKRNSFGEEEEWGEFTRFVNFDGNLRPPGSPSHPEKFAR